MTFFHPIALLSLIPLVALAIWLLSRRSTAARVPFVELWRDAAAASPRVGRRALPPLAILLFLASSFVAVFAASDVRLAERAGGRATVTLLIDDTPAMRRSPGFAAAIDRVKDELIGIELVRLRFSSTDSEETINVSQLAGIALPAAGEAELDNAIGRALRETDDIIVAVTDRAPAVRSDRLAVIGLPRDGPRIAQAAASRDQTMVTVDNIHADTVVTVQSKSQHADRSLQATAGERQTVFIDLPIDRDDIEIRLSPPRGDVAHLIRQGAAALPRRVGNLSPDLARMIDAYAEVRHAHPTGDDFPVVENLDQLGSGRGAVDTRGERSPPAASPIVIDHAITRNVRWPTRDIRLATPPGDGWTPLVTLGGVPTISIRETPARQVFVGLSADGFEESADYVILWANIFEWIGGETTFVLEEKTTPRTPAAVDDLRALAAARRTVADHRPSLVASVSAGAIALLAAAFAASSGKRRRSPTPVDTRR